MDVELLDNDKPNKASNTPVDSDQHPVVAELRHVVSHYLKSNPNVTINGLSSRCDVSEPTLRRIVKGQVKTLTNTTTIMNILTYISREENPVRLIEKYPGPISDYLKSNLGAVFFDTDSAKHSIKVNRHLQNPTKFLIFCFAQSPAGLSIETVKEMFGLVGLSLLEELVSDEILVKNGDLFRTEDAIFTCDHQLFKTHFKALTDFIKPEKLDNNLLNNVFSYSVEHVNQEAFKKIVKLQSNALRKILEILNDKANRGPVPIFVLGAVDTLSDRSASEISESENTKLR